MKLFSYFSGDQAGWGFLAPHTAHAFFVDGIKLTAGRYRSVRQLLRDGGLSALTELATLTVPPDCLVPLDAVTLAPPVPDPGKILCVGFNYRAHAAEAQGEITPYPNLFIRFPDTLVAHAGALLRPHQSEQFDYEGELAVVIGKPGRHIGVDLALSHVAGYTCFNDASVRDLQKQSVVAGKNFLGTGAMGPWLVSADEIPDPSTLTLTTRLNGAVVQHGEATDMAFPVAHLISYISTFTPLDAGDIIVTGTPSGIGARRTPPLWMRPGDVVEVDIPGVGVLRNRVAAGGFP
jgi:2-keto-4-pentenoate hydratase/2-oxohepta-3-ene-1,7-dioic acid hydratase in catechol pathway